MEVLMGNTRTMIMFSIIEKIDIVVLPEDILRGQRKFPATCRAIHKEGGGPNNAVRTKARKRWTMRRRTRRHP